MRVARPVVLIFDQREILESHTRARRAPARSVERARIVLLAAAGLQPGSSVDTAVLWLVHRSGHGASLANAKCVRERS